MVSASVLQSAKQLVRQYTHMRLLAKSFLRGKQHKSECHSHQYQERKFQQDKEHRWLRYPIPKDTDHMDMVCVSGRLLEGWSVSQSEFRWVI
jgi:hypothetical protein